MPRNIDQLTYAPDQSYFTPEEAALFLGTTRQALAVRRTEGRRPDYYKSQRTIRYKKADLIASFGEKVTTEAA